MMPCESHPLGLDPPDVILYILEALFHIIEAQGSLTPRSPNYITSCSARCTVYYLLILVNLNALIHKRDKTSIYILLCTHTHNKCIHKRHHRNGFILASQRQHRLCCAPQKPIVCIKEQ